jgi:hypothetical protein
MRTFAASDLVVPHAIADEKDPGMGIVGPVVISANWPNTGSTKTREP